MTSNKKPVGVLPLGDVPEIVLKVIAGHITRCFKLTTQILPSLEKPEYALDKRRLQYNAGIIIETFESMHFGNHDKVIAVLNQDLFIPIFTHVFGEARQGGNCSLVSLFRLVKNPDGSSPLKPLIHERAAKVALHELGHLFNLLHCEHKQCLMHFSGSIEELDEMSLQLCEYCSIYLQDKLR
ncbi:MAG: archaemetzincin family Zn-dependent metalloprotease [Deltaproteobacteria bacterium]|nr:archaemetzincin family Zn-dependent metalloprotease [Deltaproteobacteria bacterium]